MKWFPRPARPGDVIRVALKGVFHYGIFVSEAEVIQFGLPPLPQYQKPAEEIVVCATDLDIFSCGQVYETAVSDWKERLKGHSRRETVRLARSRLGQGGYDLLHNNCEHFAYECAYGVSRSEQEQAVRRRWRDRPILDVYIALIEASPEEAPVYPPAREKYIRATGNDALRAARRQVWQTLRAGVEHSFGYPFEELRFQKDRRGKWSCDRFHFSLSHTGGAVAAAVSNAPVGVDLENIPAFCEKHRDGAALTAMAGRALTEEELAEFEASPEAFLPFWTQKECLYKREGGETFSPAAIDTLRAETRTRTLREPPLCLSVCGEHLTYVRYFMVRGNAVELLFSKAFRDGSDTK